MLKVFCFSPVVPAAPHLPHALQSPTQSLSGTHASVCVLPSASEQEAPDPDLSCVTEYVRDFCDVDESQAPNAPHSPIHGWLGSVQVVSSSVAVAPFSLRMAEGAPAAEQVAPPFCDVVWTVQERLRVPSTQADHAPAVTWQLTAHACSCVAPFA